MARIDLIAKQITIAMAALEAAFSLLDIDEEEKPRVVSARCSHEGREFYAMGRWVCPECGLKGEVNGDLRTDQR